jgi:hypothetical protein
MFFSMNFTHKINNSFTLLNHQFTIVGFYGKADNNY